MDDILGRREGVILLEQRASLRECVVAEQSTHFPSVCLRTALQERFRPLEPCGGRPRSEHTQDVMTQNILNTASPLHISHIHLRAIIFYSQDF